MSNNNLPSTSLKFYGQFEYQLDKYLYDNFFKDTYNGVSLEAGASNGVLENTTKFFEDHMQWKTINVEPLPDWYNELTHNRPNSININRCIHPISNDAIQTFSIPCLQTHGYKNHLGSLNKSNVTKYNVDIKEINVETITYNKIMGDNNVTKLDLFVLDIEGYEIEFLKTFQDWAIYPKVLVIEVGHLDENTITEMISSKYKLYSKLYVNNIYVLR